VPPLSPDSLVLEGRFRVIRPLGAGGMGEVYLCEQVSLGRKVAIKVLHHDLHMQPGMAERFKREARLLSAVEHPAVVRIIDFGESDDSACLVMELVEGVSLHEALTHGPLAPARALAVLHQLAEGLAAIHDKGIIHRDIKPENVFLTPTPKGEQARLLDFGIARLVEPDADSAVSQVGVVLGTPEYLSPEQAIGARVDARSDLYCLGVLAYRILSGRLPFEGPSPRQFVAQHANATPLSLDRAAPALSINPGLVALVMRLLEKDPANRFQSAQVLAEALIAVAAGPLPAALAPPGQLTPMATPPVSSGTAVFGGAPAPASGNPPPLGSGTAVFGAEAPSAPDPEPRGPTLVIPPSSSGTAAFGVAAPLPSPAVPSSQASLPPPASSGTAIFGEPAQPPAPVSIEALPSKPPLPSLMPSSPRRFKALGGAAGVLLLIGVGLWIRNQSLTRQAQLLLDEGKPAEALERLDESSVEENKTPESLRVRALALHALNRHDEEHGVLDALDAEAWEDLDTRVLDRLAEDFGRNEGNKRLSKVLGSLPKKLLHEYFEELAEAPYSPKQWGALRYLESAQDTEELDLVGLYSAALASEHCDVRAKAARRLGALGDTDAVSALTQLAEEPRAKQPPGAKNCGQDEAAAALRILKKAQ
jgi:serine/threonine protein kinase